MHNITPILSALFALFTFGLQAQDTFYDLNTIQEVRIYFGSSNWDYQLDTAAAGTDGYIIADSVNVNGVNFPQAGVKYKGNSSYSASRVKNPFHIKLDKVIDQDYEGHEDIKLANGFSDPSMVREVSAYSICRQYMDAPRCNYARVYVNGAYWGLYTNSEDVGNSFAEDHYHSSYSSYFKCNPRNVMSGTGSSLIYLGTDSSLYYNYYELQSDYGWGDLIRFCDSLTNHPNYAHTFVDVDRALWMLAYNNVLVNLDSYSGGFRQNYYLYYDHNRRWIPTVWDVNMAYGSFTNTGAGGGGGGGGVTAMQNLTPVLHETDANWPLIRNLLSDPMYKRMYLAHMRTLNNENFANADYKNLIGQLRTLIDSSVQADPNFLYTYTQYQSNLTTTVSGGGGGPGGTCGVYELMDTRTTYLSGTTQLSAAPPAISAVAADPATAVYGSTVNITASVSNALSSAVYLGYRYKHSDVFVRVAMSDDGLHGDGAAGDGVYGATIPVNSLKMEYYLYAENASAGMFSPERAEHEFYTLFATITMATSADVTVNEFLAGNSSGITNEEGKYKDWIEVKNKTGVPLGLGDLYLSNDLNNRTKWQFPRTAILPANGYLLIWADDQNTTWIDYHTNFNLTLSGDTILLSDSLGVLADSILYQQQTQDLSASRCADGTGPFVDGTTPTPRAMNDCASTGYYVSAATDALIVYPNPASDLVSIRSEKSMQRVEILDLQGQVIEQRELSGDKQVQIGLERFSPGLYLLRVDGLTPVRLVIQ
ncbi:CotH kinase family protein [Candidatus Pollutiaquabacter sp.]|uniref:CotH kinase family protein n=1 Tax=Candidatus Pollutiaquabacter sp. TaxID=3416354 RepID=UPI003CA181C8|nr:CotH kinase family protein [Bacteroidota bacterium]